MSVTRELAIRLGRPQFEDTTEGLLVHAVPALMEGTWTDSLAQTALYYTREAMAKYAGHWIDNGLWARHTGGQPRAVTEKVGEVRNPRYKLLGDKGAVLVDLLIYGNTSKGRDAQELVKAGHINYVSVEHGGSEYYNPETKQLESQSLVFSGLALVSKGACETCTIAARTEAELRQREAAASQSESQSQTGDSMNDKELEDAKAALADLLKQQAEMQAKAQQAQQEAFLAQMKTQAEAQQKLMQEQSALLQAQAAEQKKLSESLTGAVARLDKLEKSPVPPATVVTPAAGQETDIPAIVPRVRWNKRTGEISQED